MSEQSLVHLLGLMANGKFHSGEVLGEALGVGRGTVWNLVRRAMAMGLVVDRVPGRGYRLAQPLEFLQPERVRTALGDAALPFEILFSVDSTNRHMMALAQRQPSRAVAAVFAEHQTDGRGRRGRAWVSPVAANLYCSVLRRFQSRPAALEGVSLVTALAVLRALRDVGIADAVVKWPNDIYARGRKLAGILLEMGGEPGGACYIVAGIGINVRMSAQAGAAIDQRWIDAASLATGALSRNVLAGRLLARVIEAYAVFEQQGLEVFLDEWYRYDITYRREVELHLTDKTVVGTAVGVDAHGALLLEHDGEIRRYFSGDVSVRLPAGSTS